MDKISIKIKQKKEKFALVDFLTYVGVSGGVCHKNLKKTEK